MRFNSGLLFVLYLLWSGAAHGQPKLYEQTLQIQKAPITTYLKYSKIKELHSQLVAEKKQASMWLQAPYNDYAAFFGDYRSAEKTPIYKVKPLNYDSIGKLYPQKTSALLKAAKATQLLFINEAHHIPKHRFFITQHLKQLYARGFRYLASEFVLTADTAFINQHGFLPQRAPAQQPVFEYYQEPLYADMIRQAIKIGYKIIPIEIEKSDSTFNKYGVSIKNGQQMRDWTMAANLYKRVLTHKPNAKVLVHCGYDHARKVGWELDFMPMAYYIKQITPSLKILTVDQAFSSRNEKRKKLYQMMASKSFAPILLDNRRPENKFFRHSSTFYKRWKQDYQDWFDWTVFHPPHTYAKGRPAWLFAGSGRQYIALPQKVLDIKEGCVIEAYFEQEAKLGIPIDRVIKQGGQQTGGLALPKGVFYIKVTNKKGEQLLTYTINVK